ncbi:MAG: RNA polymerase sigma factor [Tannerellaceae bacterium]|jgi:RNA polymerase sigma factor (sigma-70 family)|nr:RNA polymerase sigma factor [Tannerellaceae bacterium]
MPQRDVTEVVKTYRLQLRNFIRRRVSSVEDAEDILQEVFYRLAKMDSLSRPVENIAAWLYCVARNQIINSGVKKREEAYPVWQGDDDAMLEDLAEIMFDSDASPEVEYLHSLVWSELDAALAELPAAQRDVFEKTELRGLSVKETAEATGVAVNTVLSRKRYAVLYLRERLRGLYMEVITGV